ncbi:GTPase [Streptomyces sp. NPDC059002]|uniref:GTPase n=1 Tax=Streptomyces sp. NPDC059002 TaxID=3346690 RepID=UPI0036C39E22
MTDDPTRPTSLEDALGQAVRSTRSAMDDLHGQVGELLDRLGAEDYGPPTGISSRGEELLECRRAIVERTRRRAGDLLERRRQDFDTFTIALFGRTGTGKSSLVEALTSGSGVTVSDGAADWTTEVRVTRWADCRLLDTPGTCGYGRTRPREELERAAQDVVIAADLVILCFSDHSQQESEFQKVAEWIRDYGKPTVAALNVHTSAWHLSPRVTTRDARERLSKAVGDHASRIRAQLEALGLPWIPVVAVSALRAVLSRCTPYQGPDPELCSELVGLYGRDALLAWSRLRVLEDLLVTVIERDPVGLRLGALALEVRGALQHASDRLRSALEEPAVADAEAVEETIRRELEMFGVPVARGRPEFDRLAADVRALSAESRCPLEIPESGSAHEHAATVISDRLRLLRSEALSRAQTAVEDAFGTKKNLDNNAFEKQVFDKKALEQAAEDIVAEINSFVDRRQAIIADDFKERVSAFTGELGGVHGTAGRARRVVSGVGSVTSAGIGAFAVDLAAEITAVTVWNPALVVGGLVVGAVVLAFAAVWQRRKAKEARAAQLREAHKNARTAVTDAFAQYEKQLLTAIDEILAGQLLDRVGPSVREARVLRRVATSAVRSREDVDKVRAGVRVPEQSPDRIVTAAAAHCRKRAGAARAPDGWWLGHAWCTERDGWLEEGDRRTPPEQDAAPVARRVPREPATADPHFLRRVRGVVRAAFHRDRPGAGDGRAWLKRVADALDPQGDEREREVVDTLRALAARRRSRVVVCGDYNSGKSSLIRRLLVDAGLAEPECLAVGAAPTTAAVAEYAYGDLVLVDTPGFQSGLPGHTEQAMAAVCDASAVLYVFGPVSVGGDRDVLRRILRGDAGTRSLGRAPDTLYVINRMDLFVSYAWVSRPTAQAKVTGKQRELSDVLRGAAGGRRYVDVDVPPERILCVASAPDGIPVDVDHPPDDDRDWDGMADLARVLSDIADGLARNGTAIAVLHGGHSRISRLLGERRAEADLLDDRLTAVLQLTGEVESAVREGRGRLRAIEAELTTKVRTFLRGLVDAPACDPDLGPATARRLSAWSRDEELVALVDDFIERSQESFLAWGGAASRFLADLVAGSPRIAGALSADAAAAGSVRPFDPTLGEARDILQTSLAGLSRAAPEIQGASGALAAAARFAGPAAVGLSVVGVVQDQAADRKAAKQRRAQLRSLDQDAADWVRRILRHPSADPGLHTVWNARIDALDAFVRRQQEDAVRLRAQRDGLHTKVRTYQRLLSDARRRLRIPDEPALEAVADEEEAT